MSETSLNMNKKCPMKMEISNAPTFQHDVSDRILNREHDAASSTRHRLAVEHQSLNTTGAKLTLTKSIRRNDKPFTINNNI